jgi:hypothetical protein
VFGVGSKLVTGSDDLVICQINLIECKSFWLWNWFNSSYLRRVPHRLH